MPNFVTELLSNLRVLCVVEFLWFNYCSPLISSDLLCRVLLVFVEFYCTEFAEFLSSVAVLHFRVAAWVLLYEFCLDSESMASSCIAVLCRSESFLC